MKRTIIYFAITLFSFSFLACGNVSRDSEQTNDEQVSRDDEAASTSQPEKSAESQSIIIKQSTGQELGSIVLGNEIEFRTGGVLYQSRLKGEKRKYATQSGNIVAEVKFKSEAFKLRTADGKLLWKVKLYDDKVKISDNEENKNPYQIKLSSSEKAKLKHNDQELGTIRFRPDKQHIEINSAGVSLVVAAEKLSLAYGVFLIDELSEAEKFVIAAELLSKGK